MKTVFLGSTKFSEELLLHLLNNRVSVDLLFTIPREFSISYSDKSVTNYNHSDLQVIAQEFRIPCFEIESGKKQHITDFTEEIRKVTPDVILVMGWYYMVPQTIRDLAKYGAWGIHASMLPDYAGGAPLVWAMIEGRKKTGITLFKLADGVDDGDIIAQKEIDIDDNDTISEVYDKVIEKSKDLLLINLQNIENIKFTPQDKSKIKVYPQRKPEDGEIDLSWPAKQIYDFIRAQSAPYPGAFIRTTDGKKIIIEKAKISE